MEPENYFAPYPTCPKCGKDNKRFRGFEHAEICEYFLFRDVTAPRIKWHLLIMSRPQIKIIKEAFDALRVEHRAFEIRGNSGEALYLFAPKTTVDLVNLYYSDKSPYGDMSLSEFLGATLGVMAAS